LKYNEGDIIGCGFNVMEKKIFFTLNGTLLKREFVNVDVEVLTPSLGLKKIATKVTFNFGLTPFMFNIRNYIRTTLSNLQK
jgi:hypothetical protein